MRATSSTPGPLGRHAVPAARQGLWLLGALLAGCVGPRDRIADPPPAAESPLARAAAAHDRRQEYVPLIAPSSGGADAARTAPPPRPKPAPPVAHPNLLALGAPLSVMPLEPDNAFAQPHLYVPADTVAGYYATACRAVDFGLYRQDRKVGWERRHCAVDFAARPPRITFTSRGVVQEHAFGATETVAYEESQTWRAAPGGTLVTARRTEHRGRATRVLLLRRKGRAWVWTETRAGADGPPVRQERTLLDAPLALSQAAPAVRPALVAGLLPLGAPRRVRRLDLEAGRIDTWLVQLEATAERTIRGVRLPLRGVAWLRLRDGAALRVTTDASGTPLFVQPGEDGLRRVVEPPATARRGLGARVLFGLGAFFPAPNEDLAEQEQIETLRAQLRGPDLMRFHRPPRQRVTVQSPGHALLAVATAPWNRTPPKRPFFTHPVRTPGLQAWLSDRPDLRITDPGLVRAAQRHSQGRHLALQAAVALGRFVHRHLRGRLLLEPRTAPEILRSGVGDSADRARLLVALCRAVGIPAREVGGLVWEPALESFVVDTWVEVAATADLAVPLDPTRGQFPARATHIVLGAPEDPTWHDVASRVTVELPPNDPPPEPDPAPRVRSAADAASASVPRDARPAARAGTPRSDAPRARRRR